MLNDFFPEVLVTPSGQSCYYKFGYFVFLLSTALTMANYSAMYHFRGSPP